MGCKYFMGVISFKGKKNYIDPNAFAMMDGRTYYIGHSDCNYISKDGSPRGCRPEICPYNETNKKGIKLKAGEQYVLFDALKGGCFECKHKDLDGNEDPCKKCLKTVKRQGTNVPLYFEKEDKRNAGK